MQIGETLGEQFIEMAGDGFGGRLSGGDGEGSPIRQKAGALRFTPVSDIGLLRRQDRMRGKRAGVVGHIGPLARVARRLPAVGAAREA
ncbi:hypothetical protein [Cypionkella sp.]|uniref:hypothetical protein n=1 Tax=Cypionkella sp. TaxID=2811411 RepID=UPI0026313660|nr:hypothetical protein [Cypionkella sp.]